MIAYCESAEILTLVLEMPVKIDACPKRAYVRRHRQTGHSDRGRAQVIPPFAVGVPQDDLPVSTVHTVRRTAGQVQQLAEVKATERSLPHSNARTISVADWWH
jgi:hypothetical protein